MQNRKLYIIISIISIFLMLPSWLWRENFAVLLSNIGYSGIAASIMAIYIERNAEKKEQKKNRKSKTFLFQSIKRTTKYVI